MPPDRVEPLDAEQLYAICAYELYMNGLIARDAIVDRSSLPRIQMRNLAGFLEVTR
jgi:cytochrome c